MSFGRNPHVARAEAAELKAGTANDDLAREAAWRDAARQWDRAAERETDNKRRQEYAARAETARTAADEPAGSAGERKADDEPAATNERLN
jgi:hypothetical protein